MHGSLRCAARWWLIGTAWLTLAAASPLDRPMPNGAGRVTILRGAAALVQPSLQAAIAAAQPRDVIELGEGTYVGAVVVSQRPDLTIRAAPQAHAVLTQRDARFAAPNTLWEPLEGVSGVWRTSTPVGMSLYRADGRRILWAKDRAHFDVVRASGVAVALRETGRTLLYLERADPRTTPLLVSVSDAPVILCDRSPRLRLEALDVRFGGAQGIDIRDGCDGWLIDGVSVYGARDGVRVKNGVSGGGMLRRSWIANHLDTRWYWRDLKGNLFMEGTAVAIAGQSQVVEESVIEGWFNGIGIPCAGCRSTDLAVQRSLLRGILDDSFELDGTLVGGEIHDNRVVDAFVGVSCDPRFTEPGRSTRFYRNTFEVMRRPPFDRSPATLGRPSFTKIQPSIGVDGKALGPSDLDFYQNTLVGDAEIAKGAPQGSGIAYPLRVRWRNNVMVSRVGPIVRHTGTRADGNEFEGNLYMQMEPGTMFQNWALAPGQSASYPTLGAARTSAAGLAAGWEAQGLEGAPSLALDSAPALPTGWPDSVTVVGSRDRGAFERATFQVDSVEPGPTGWVVARGRGFEPGSVIRYQGTALRELQVLSSTVALGRLNDTPPDTPILLEITTEP
jgi:hypothetical protein